MAGRECGVPPRAANPRTQPTGRQAGACPGDRGRARGAGGGAAHPSTARNEVTASAMQGAEWTGIPDESRVPRVCVPLAAFHSENCCLLYADGCEDIEWIREQFGDPVELSQRFIREAYLRFRGIG